MIFTSTIQRLLLRGILTTHFLAFPALMIYYFLLVCTISFFISLVINYLLIRSPWLFPDVPNFRSAHTITIPRGGGIGFILPIVLILLLINYYFTGGLPQEILVMLLGSFCIALLGIWEDRSNIPIIVRAAILLLVVGFSVNFGLSQQISLFGLYDINGIYARIFQVLYIFALINIYNFMDGLDGLGAFQGIFISIFVIIIIFNFENNIETDVLLVYNLIFVALLGGLLGFIFFNRSPASIFMGDCGSYFLGYIFSFLSFLLPDYFSKSVLSITTTINTQLLLNDFFLIPLLLMPFSIDVFFTLCRRYIQKRNIFYAHRGHFYQLLNRTGYSPLAIIFRFTLLNLLFLPAILIRIYSPNKFYLSTGIIMGVLFTLLYIGYSVYVIINSNRNLDAL